MDILVADGSLAEFGWELMSWQGVVRRKAHEFDEIVICTTRGLEALYSDMTDKFITHNVPLLRDCFEQRKIHDVRAWRAYRDRIDATIKGMQNNGHEVTYLRAKKYVPIDKQLFVPYGHREDALARGDLYDVLLHARNKESNNKYYRIYNWAIEKWNVVVQALLKRGLRVAAIGTKSGAFLPEGAADLRGIDLQRLMDMMAASTLVIGPSSGPMHLASLCKAPHLVWTGKQWSSTIKAFNAERYEWKWNPFRTKCYMVVKDNPDLSAAEVVRAVERALDGQEPEDKPTEIPGRAAATKWITYWRNRVKKQGRAYVARSGRGMEKQTKIIGERLVSAFGGGHFDHGLDFGCGWGRFTDVIAEHCDKVTAVDIVSTLRDDLPRKVKFQLLDFPTKLKLPDGSVDLFVAALVFQHIVNEPWLENIAEELRRVLADSATVIIVDDNGKPAAHVKQRPPMEFKRLLGLDWVEDKLLDMDGPSSHHVVIGSHRKD